MGLDVGLQGIRDFHGGGGAVFADRHVAQHQDGLGQEVLIQRDAGHGVGGGGRRMGVHHGVHVRALPVDAHMHFDFGGGVQLALQLVAVGVDFDDHVGGHEALGHAGGGAVIFVLADLDGDIAVVGRDEAVHVNPPADFADFLFDFIG